MTGKPEKSILLVIAEQYDDLVRGLTRKLGSEDRARDALHDTWLHLERPDAMPDTVHNPKAFVMRVAQNLAKDRARRDTWLNRITEVLDELELQDDTPGPGEHLESQEDIRALTTALMQLPKRQRDVLIALKHEGLSRSEIAGRLGISKRMVSYELATALEFCQNYLSARKKA